MRITYTETANTRRQPSFPNQPSAKLAFHPDLSSNRPSANLRQKPILYCRLILLKRPRRRQGSVTCSSISSLSFVEKPAAGL